MPAFSGSFSGRVTTQSAFSLNDQPNHDMSIAEVNGTQKSSDQNWNNAAVVYWGVTDLLDGQGTQRGYYLNNHADGDREFGTFEGKATAKGGEITVEGTWTITGGTGKYKGATGTGTFKTRGTAQGGVECTWQGAYELVSAKAQAH